MTELSGLTWYGCHPRRSRGFRGACGGVAMDRNSAAQRHVGAGHVAVQRRWIQDCRPLLELTIPNPAGQAVQGLPWGRVLQELRNRRASPGHPRPCAITSIPHPSTQADWSAPPSTQLAVTLCRLLLQIHLSLSAKLFNHHLFFFSASLHLGSSHHDGR